MDLRQLRYLVVLGEEEHFTRAARRLGIAQPALSQQIKRLEVQVGVALVERSTRSVRMTDAGRTTMVGARRILREVDALGDELDALRGVRSGRVVVGVTRTPGAVDVAALLARFARAHPGVELDVREDLTVELLAMLDAGTLDVALVAEGSSAESGTLEVRTVAVEPLVVIVPVGHELADGRDVSIVELARHRIVTFHRGATIRRQLEERAFTAGVVLRVAFDIADAQRARSVVANGLAVGVLPRSDARAPGPEVAVVPFADATLQHRTAVAVRRDRRPTPAADALLALIDGAAAPVEG
ncbi:LysR family transcriptional regulator [Patulibacter sp. NPDC049589]|uniref:LysR family transcriptional regulator n=1 Tax=Patulibacter sp. NPDC049589 TaxID=3154731 RepID=UPI00342DA93B